LNSDFILDFCKVVGSVGEVKLSFKDGKSAALLEPEAANRDIASNCADADALLVKRSLAVRSKLGIVLPPRRAMPFAAPFRKKLNDYASDRETRMSMKRTDG